MSPLTTHGVVSWPSGYGAGRHCDQQVAGSNPSRRAVEYNPGQVVNTHVPLSPSSIIWYQPMGGDAWQLEGNRGSGGK